MPLGAVVCNDRVHVGTNGNVEDMESRDGEERKCLRGNMKKTKIMVPGPNLDLLVLPSKPNFTSFSENVLLL